MASLRSLLRRLGRLFRLHFYGLLSAALWCSLLLTLYIRCLSIRQLHRSPAIVWLLVKHFLIYKLMLIFKRHSSFRFQHLFVLSESAIETDRAI